MKSILSKVILLVGVLLVGAGGRELRAINKLQNQLGPTLGHHECGAMGIGPEYEAARQWEPECRRNHQVRVEAFRQSVREATARGPYAWAVIAVGGLCFVLGGIIALPTNNTKKASVA